MNITFENALYMDVGFSQGDSFNVGFTGDTQENIGFNPNAVSFNVAFSEHQSFDVDFGGTAQIVPYTGAYEFTPTNETQTVEINGKTASNNITINPIPSNYGLISWSGSGIKVS